MKPNNSGFYIHHLNDLVLNWGIELESLSENDRIPGSPQRSICRQLFKARNGKLYFIQGFDESGERRKNKINSVLETLKEEGIPRIQLPIKTIEDKNLVKYNGLTWQIFEYIEGMELKRPDYQEEPWRGRRFAEILKDLKSVTSAVFGKLPKEPKFMESFLFSFRNLLKENKPEIYQHIKNAFSGLEVNLLPKVEILPKAFAHGDLHPLNVIWGEEDIISIIDWEFMGIRPEGYDLANLIGCLGFEHPKYLNGLLIKELISQINIQKLYSSETMELLPLFILFSRIAWLSTWLYSNDHEMTELEIEYITGLLK